MTTNTPRTDQAGYADTDKQADIKILHTMGYAQELERRMSRFSNFAISFPSSAFCPAASIRWPRRRGAGGASIGIGWPLGCFISGVFAVAMGADRLGLSDGGRALSLGLDSRQPGFTGWLTAWLNLLGLVTVLGAINVGTWGFFPAPSRPGSLAITSTRDARVSQSNHLRDR